jgi:hypothetical protein
VFAALLAFTVGLVALSIPAGILTVFFTRLSPLYSWSSTYPLYLWIGPLFVLLPARIILGLYFLGLTALYIMLLAYSAKQGVGPWTAVAQSLRKGLDSVLSSPFIVTMASIGFLAFTASIVDQVVSGTAPLGDTMLELETLTVAPVVEELGFRLVLIGLVVALISAGRPWKELVRVLWRPSATFDGRSGQGATKVLVAALVAFSALVFGITHVASGWTIGKVFEATYGGLVLGYLYVRYGFHVAVLTHWGVNYVGNIFAFFGQGVAGIPWNSPTKEYFLQQVVDVDLLLLFGLVSFLLVVYSGLQGMAKRRGTMSEPQSEVQKGLEGESPGGT